MGTCTAFVFAALVEFTFVNYTWRTRGKLPGIPTGLETQENLVKTHANGDDHHDKNLLSLEMVRIHVIINLYIAFCEDGAMVTADAIN